jgi:hypothetical protein
MEAYVGEICGELDAGEEACDFEDAEGGAAALAGGLPRRPRLPSPDRITNQGPKWRLLAHVISLEAVLRE